MNIVQVKHQNKDATMPLIVPVLVMPNTPEEEIDRHIIENSKKNLEWIMASEPHDGTAILCGGGPSIKNHVEDICRLKIAGGTVFALNGAAKWLIDQGIEVDYQTILDAKRETASLVEPRAKNHLFSSQCNPETVDSVRPILYHLNNVDVEKLFPQERRERGGYALVGGGVSVGITSMVLSYVMGFREIHLFGYDSSHENSTHAYEQPMNKFIPNCEVEWGQKTYTCSMPMKAQAEAFPTWAKQLQQAGCKLSVYGKGLLQAIWSEPPASEKQKYKLMWSDRIYRVVSPGEDVVDTFIEIVNPDGRVIDFGCGTGRGAKAIHDKTGCEVILIDFADNCRDEETQYLPFIEWDLNEPLPISSTYGYCTDVMEHIPEKDVDKVIHNIMQSSTNVFFQICTVEDISGERINQILHLTVKPYQWWYDKFIELGYTILWSKKESINALFFINTGLLPEGMS